MDALRDLPLRMRTIKEDTAICVNTSQHLCAQARALIGQSRDLFEEMRTKMERRSHLRQQLHQNEQHSWEQLFIETRAELLSCRRLELGLQLSAAQCLWRLVAPGVYSIAIP